MYVCVCLVEKWLLKLFSKHTFHGVTYRFNESNFELNFPYIFLEFSFYIKWNQIEKQNCRLICIYLVL